MYLKEKVVFIPELEDCPPARRMWTVYEESVLEEYYGRTDSRKLAEFLDRSIRAVQNKASLMGLSKGIEHK